MISVCWDPSVEAIANSFLQGDELEGGGFRREIMIKLTQR